MRCVSGSMKDQRRTVLCITFSLGRVWSFRPTITRTSGIQLGTTNLLKPILRRFMDDPETIIRRYIEQGFNGRNSAVAESLFSPAHKSRTWGDGPAGIRAREEAFIKAFPDAIYRIDDLVATGDAVCVRATLIGTHQGELRGIEPTGRRVHFESITIYRFDEGRIVSSVGLNDWHGLAMQLGQPFPS